MEQRINIETASSEAWKALYALSVITSKYDLSPIQKHLIKVRVSQINGCAYCINMHTKEALRSGETQQRLFLLSAWNETDLFTPEEKAMLRLTEEVTLIHNHGVSDQTYQEAGKYFSPEVIGQIIMSAITMNAWNRIAVSTHKPIVD
ncbi:carboxymuconolactone decarboxylase family protein [Segetibacter sp. 3557_3]|uniref:carboxymuconolactone decarboxylase family protein n=1 Tax=Segetibacter sp. 3557_3 TaxID=2547429 RepID=UPI0010586C31|nr:carboxymuconolactone decarboxylase family protein [Segetibacter sp. 3557_3]TDH28565.1 carboxymuconolactone decarboxylase family protein [Segetibacter sp. 3557_3]